MAASGGAAVAADARRAHRLAGVAMDTLVTLDVVSAAPTEQVGAALRRALDWFAAVERACSRFDPRSELRRLVARVGRPTPAGPILFEATRFALALAFETGGAFDPTVGKLLEARGFDRDYRTGERIRTPTAGDGGACYRDVELDPVRRTITLHRPLLLDLGAVAKGLAIDLAARELAPFADFCVEAGGDLYAGGRNAEGRPWQVAVQHPREPQAAVRVLAISDRAVCTSGDYERRAPDGGHHLVDPRSGRPAAMLAGVTVVAPSALVADGLGTAAFILGPRAGLRLLEREGVGGLLVLPDGQVRATPGLAGVAE